MAPHSRGVHWRYAISPAPLPRPRLLAGVRSPDQSRHPAHPSHPWPTTLGLRLANAELLALAPRKARLRSNSRRHSRRQRLGNPSRRCRWLREVGHRARGCLAWSRDGRRRLRFAQIEDAVTVHPLFKTLKQDPAGLARLGLSELQSKTILNWQGKHQLSIDDVYGRPQPDRIMVRLFVYPRSLDLVGPDSTHGQQGSVLALAPSGVSQIPGDRGSMFAFAADLARRLPAYEILLGTTRRRSRQQ